MPKQHKKSKCHSSSSNESCATPSLCKPRIFEHNIQLQLFDVYGVPVPDTQFWIIVTILKEGKKITLQLPTINWQSGPFANAPYEPPNSNPYGVPGTFPPFNAGYLYTVEGFLPKKVRPNDIENRSWLVASNNGMSEAFSFTQDPSTLPVPPAGYILQVTNFGGLVIQTAGTFGNSASPGAQIVLPTTVSYIVKPQRELKFNTKITSAPTNVTQFTGAGANTALRDFHTNDAFAGIVAFTWSDNSNQVDKTNGVMNLMVTVGKIGKDGKLKTRKPVQLTNLAPGFFLFDTAVAINRTNKNNIVVTYSVANESNPFETGIFIPICRAVSLDGGKTWPAPFDGVNSLPLNGLTNIQPTGFVVPGLVRGGSEDGIRCQSDKFGNIWCYATNAFDDFGNLINQPFFMVSTDQGITYTLVYTTPFPDIANGFFYDFPQFCFGGDGLGNYGLWFRTDYGTPETGDQYFDVGFIPITGLGQYDASATTFAELKAFTNNLQIGSITASSDGRMWIFGYTTGFGPSLMAAPMSSITSMRMTFKSPGAIDSNYAGPWDFNIANYADAILLSGQDLSYPGNSYFNSVQTNIYDDKRQALYQTSIGHAPDLGQDMRLYFAISRDNGQTWSQPIDISNSDIGNRGFQSMALDVEKGDLYFGWYDGRHNPDAGDLNYYGTVIPAKTLDKLVDAIPLSNPLYTVPPATMPPTTTSLATTPIVEKTLVSKRRPKIPLPKTLLEKQ